MITGTYAVSLQTPMGLEKGKVTFRESGGALSGTLIVSGVGNPIQKGKADGNTFEISGTIRKAFFRISYTAKGEVNGDTLTATAYSKYGSFVISGVRI